MQYRKILHTCITLICVVIYFRHTINLLIDKSTCSRLYICCCSNDLIEVRDHRNETSTGSLKFQSWLCDHSWYKHITLKGVRFYFNSSESVRSLPANIFSSLSCYGQFLIHLSFVVTQSSYNFFASAVVVAFLLTIDSQRSNVASQLFVHVSLVYIWRACDVLCSNNRMQTTNVATGISFLIVSNFRFHYYENFSSEL